MVAALAALSCAAVVLVEAFGPVGHVWHGCGEGRCVGGWWWDDVGAGVGVGVGVACGWGAEG